MCNYVAGCVNLLRFFLLFFEYEQVLFVCFNCFFTNKCFVLSTCLTLGHMGLTNREICLLVGWLIFLACSACLFGVFICFINFFLTLQSLAFFVIVTGLFWPRKLPS